MVGWLTMPAFVMTSQVLSELLNSREFSTVSQSQSQSLSNSQMGGVHSDSDPDSDSDYRPHNVGVGRKIRNPASLSATP